MENFDCEEILVLCGILFWILIYWNSKKNDEETRARVVNKQRQSIEATMQKDDLVFPVIYHHGHNGVDHYLKMYLKRDSLAGTLSLTEIGIAFLSSLPRTPQKFNFAWSDVNDASCTIEDGLFRTKKLLFIKLKKSQVLFFESPNADQIAEHISIRRKKHLQTELKFLQLEEEQIHARNLDAITPKRFEELVGRIFENMGYYVRYTGGTNDEGIDLECRGKNLNEIIIVQCKRYHGNVGVPTVRDFYGVITHCRASKGFIVTTSDFTKPAINFAKGKPIELVDRKRLSELMGKYYR